MGRDRLGRNSARAASDLHNRLPCRNPGRLQDRGHAQSVGENQRYLGTTRSLLEAVTSSIFNVAMHANLVYGLAAVVTQPQPYCAHMWTPPHPEPCAPLAWRVRDREPSRTRSDEHRKTGDIEIGDLDVGDTATHIPGGSSYGGTRPRCRLLRVISYRSARRPIVRAQPAPGMAAARGPRVPRRGGRAARPVGASGPGRGCVGVGVRRPRRFGDAVAGPDTARIGFGPPHLWGDLWRGGPWRATLPGTPSGVADGQGVGRGGVRGESGASFPRHSSDRSHRLARARDQAVGNRHGHSGGTAVPARYPIQVCRTDADLNVSKRATAWTRRRRLRSSGDIFCRSTARCANHRPRSVRLWPNLQPGSHGEIRLCAPRRRDNLVTPRSAPMEPATSQRLGHRGPRACLPRRPGFALCSQIGPLEGMNIDLCRQGNMPPTILKCTICM